MPLMNSTGAFKQQNNFVITIPIVGQQWIAQYATNATAQSYSVPTSGGDVYIAYENTIIKLNTNGGKTFAITDNSTNYASCVAVDSNDNLYVGAYRQIIKYNSFGSIVWQTKINANDSFHNIVPINDTTVFALQSQSPVVGYSSTSCMYKLDGTGSVVNQRRLLKSTSTYTTCLFNDISTSSLVVTGTNFVGTRGEVVTGIYDYTNTDVASAMVTQTSTNSYTTSGDPNSLNTIVSDGTYNYQLIYRTVSSTVYSVFAKINRTTGAESYSYQILINGTACTIYGMTKDNSGYLYLYGNVSGSDTGLGFICKVQASTGTVIWAKTLGFTQQFIWGLNWVDNFLYTNTETVSGGYKSACIKLKADGSLPTGTYGTNWRFDTVTATLNSVTATTSTTTTGTNIVTSNTSSVPTYTTTTASVTVTTYNIP